MPSPKTFKKPPCAACGRESKDHPVEATEEGEAACERWMWEAELPEELSPNCKLRHPWVQDAILESLEMGLPLKQAALAALPTGRLLSVTKEFCDVGTIIQTRWEHLTVEKVEIHERIRYQHNDGSRSCRPGTARHSSALVTFAAPGALPPLRNGFVQTSAQERYL